MSSRPPPPINTAPFRPSQFFRDIVNDRDSAFLQIQNQVPLEGPATPRAQELIEAGEWDSGDKVSLVCLREDRCRGLVGTPSTDGGAPLRFCGRKLGDCTFYSHTSVKWDDYRPGWYVPAGTAAKFGFYQDPHLPLRAKGGPVDLEVGRALTDSVNPFKLTVGQWKFVIEMWWDAKVIELSDEPDSLESPVSQGADFETPREDQVNEPFESTLTDAGSKGSDLELDRLSSSSEEDGRSASSKSDSRSSARNLKFTVDELKGQVHRLIEQVNFLSAGLARERSEHVKTRSAVKKLKQASSKGATPAGTPGLVRDTQELTRRITNLESQGKQAAHTIRSVIDTANRLDDTLSDPTGEFQTMQESVERLERQMNVGGGVEAHGARFSNPSEIPGWLASTPNALALFHDAVTVLHCIGAQSVTHKATLSMMKAQKDVHITSDLEAKVVTSFRTKLPAIFYGSSSTTDDEYIELSSKLKTYKDWHADDGSSGVAQKITATSGIPEVRRRVGQMAKHSTSLAQILRLSDGLMSDSIHFIQRFVLFIDTWVLDLRDGTFFSEKQVWEIMVTTIETVFDELRAARAPMQDVADDDRCLLLWGILKAHEVMRRFLKHDFINDPTISGILIQKMIRQSPTATSGARLNTIERNLNSVSSKMVAMSTRVSNAEAKLAARE